MPTKDTTPTVLSEKQQINSNRYYRELASLSAWLFIGTLALMTFLLTVGLQHPQKPFSEFVYSTLIILPLNLFFYVMAQMVLMRPDEGKSMMAWVKAFRMVQQLLFILGLVAITGFGIVAAHIFFAPQPTAPQTQQAPQ